MRTVIAYWSGTGNTKTLAEQIADGIKSAGGTADIFSVDEITAGDVAKYEKILLGCPAMGAEFLEEDQFQPFYDELQPLLKGKTVGLFGSYDWGDGEWMREWEATAKAAGVNVLSTLIVQCADPAYKECVDFGKKFA